MSFELEIAILRWVDWVREQVADWKDSGDPGGWDAGRALAEMAADARTAVR